MDASHSLLRSRSLGMVFGRAQAARPWAVDPEVYWSAVPPPPLDLVTPAVVPEPPIPTIVEDIDGRSIRSAVDTYAAALCGYMRAHGDPIPMPVLSRTRSYASTCEAVRLLVRYRVAPAYWARYVARIWASLGRIGAPSWPFALAPATVRNGANDAIEQARAAPLGGRVVIGPRLAALLADYRTLTYRLHRDRPRSEVDLRAVVAEVFPRDTYTDRVLDAQHEAQTKQTDLRLAIVRGEWVW